VKALLHVTSGSLAGRRVRLREGEPFRVGRLGRADLVIAGDKRLAGVHFEVVWDGAVARLSDVSRRGTDVDGKSVEHATLDDGAAMVAGDTRFLFRLVPDDLRVAPLPGSASGRDDESARAALTALEAEPELFAVLDAARDRRILALLLAAEDEHRCLFDGLEAEVVARAAPYLVRLAPGSELLPLLAGEGWGESWGIYLTSRRPLREVRQRLRRSLVVRDEESDKRLFFRFYDPRVLRTFWPATTPRQRSELLGPEIASIILEGEAGEVLRLG
jgi:hypothetical protein